MPSFGNFVAYMKDNAPYNSAKNRADLAPAKTDYRPALLGFTLSLMMLIQALGEGSSIFIQFSSIFTLVVIGLISLSYHPTTKLNLILLTLIASLALVVVLGAIRTTYYFGSSAFVRPAGVLLFLLLGILLAQRKEHYLIERALPIYSITLVVVLIYILIDNDRNWGRLRGHLHPNLWAYVAETAVVGVLSARMSVLAKAVLISFFLYMIAIEFNTRSLFIWASLTIIFFLSVYIVRDLKSTRRPLFYISSIAFAFLTIAITVIVSFDYILYDIMAINSPTRGLTSNLTGRFDLWSEFWALFLEKPVFGHGFDMSRYFAENYFSGIVPGDIYSTHNSYLTMLLDFGIIGLSIYFSIIILMVVGTIKSKRIELAPFIMVALLSGLTESRPLNVGNASALLFVLLMPYCAASAFDAARRSILRSA